MFQQPIEPTKPTTQNLSNIIGRKPLGFEFDKNSNDFRHWSLDAASEAEKGFYYLKTNKSSSSTPRNHRGAESVWHDKRDASKSAAEQDEARKKKKNGPTVVYLPGIRYADALNAFGPFPRSTGGQWPGAQNALSDWDTWVARANDYMPVRIAIPSEDIPAVFNYHSIIPNRAWLSKYADYTMLGPQSEAERAQWEADYYKYWTDLVTNVVNNYGYHPSDVTFDKSGATQDPDGTIHYPAVRDSKFWRFYQELARSNAHKESEAKKGSAVIRSKIIHFINLSSKKNLRTATASIGGRTVAQEGESVGSINDNMSKILLEICDVVGSGSVRRLQRKAGRLNDYVNINRYFDIKKSKASIGSHNASSERGSSSKTAEVPEFIGRIFYKDAANPEGIEISVSIPTGIIRVAPQHAAKANSKNAGSNFGGITALENALRVLKVESAQAKAIVDMVRPKLNEIAAAAAKNKEKQPKKTATLNERTEYTEVGPSIPQFNIPQFGGYVGASSSSQSSIYGQ